jgi:hypothetical protein
MTKEEILAILDNHATGNREAMKYVIILGILMMIGGTVMFFVAEKPGNWPYIIGGVGAFFVFGAVRAKKTNMYEGRVQKIKDVFYTNPQDLVWSYESVLKGNISTTKHVVMKFRDGSEFLIEQHNIPSKKCEDLVRGLTAINPKMIVGYSEEVEKAYRAKQL